MSSFVELAIIVASMGLGTLLCGLIPLSLPLSKRMLRVLEVFGAGLLIGAAVTVVIPEGSRALFSAPLPATTKAISATLLDSTVWGRSLASKAANNQEHDWAWSFMVKRKDHDHDHHHKAEPAEQAHSNSESVLGSSILLGYLLMFVIDQLVSPSSNHDHVESDIIPPRRPEAHRLSLHRTSNIGQREDTQPVFDARDAHDTSDRPQSNVSSSATEIEELPQDYDGQTLSKGDWLASPRSSTTLRRGDITAPLIRSRRGSSVSLASHRTIASGTFGQALTTIIGLLIHAAADGIAMGASAGSGDETLTMIVFVAVMVHKAPASFGLCTMFMAQGISRANIRKAIAVFSLASPVGALVTYSTLNLLFGGSSGSPIDPQYIGTALLFSGGTFLFVATHAVTDLASASADLSPTSDVESGSMHTEILGKFPCIALVALGAWTPRILQKIVAAFGAVHHH